MATIDFPASPITGDTFSAGGKTWRFNGVAWRLQPATNAAGLSPDGRVATYSALPASGVVSGDTYYVDADNMFYIYDGSAWPAQYAGISVKSQVGFFKAYHSTTTTTSAGTGQVVVPMNTVAQNDLGTWNAATYELTIAKPGLYTMMFARASASAVQAESRIQVNGANASAPSTAGAQFYSDTQAMLYLNAGDVVRATVYRSAAVTYSVGSDIGLRIMGPF